MATKKIKVAQIDDVKKYLIKTYQSANVSQKENNFTVYVKEKEQAPRIKLGQEITEIFENAIYAQPQRLKTGTVKIPLPSTKKTIGIQVKPKKEGPIGDVGLLPGNINPKIDGIWISPENLIKNVTSYIQKSEITDEGKKEIFRVLKLTQSVQKKIPYNKKEGLISSEFFEILSAVRVCSLLESVKNPQSGKGVSPSGIRKILGIPADALLGDFKIYYPEESNFPLVDFFISVYPNATLPTGDPIKFGGDGIIRISVKNKVKSANVNTIKFKFAFDDNRDRNPQPDFVEKWYASIKNDKNKQLAQKIIAKASLTVAKKYNRVEKLYPIFAFVEILEKQNLELNKPINYAISRYKEGPLIKKYQNKNYDSTIYAICHNIVNAQNSEIKYTTPLTNFVDEKWFTKEDYSLLEEFLDLNFKDKQGGVKIKNLDLLKYAIEKIFENATNKKQKEFNWNFYKMFYDKVLTKQQVCYAITKVDNSGLIYEFSSRRNYKTLYGDWLGLRSKGTDVLGMG